MPADNSFTETERRDVLRAYKDAADKAGELPARLKDEDQQAEADGREPLPIQPLTGSPAPLVLKAIATISGDVSNELADILGVQRRSCAKVGNARVYLLSEQLKLILEAAGLGEPAPAVKAKSKHAEVQG
jgi:hypothetical protein